jgi:hypothetical protein
MGKFAANMNDFTETLFCTPADAETAKNDVKMNLSFKFLAGNHSSKNCSDNNPFGV